VKKKPLKNTLTPRERAPTNRRVGFNVGLTEDEVALIDRAAARAGLMRGAFIRTAAIEKATKS